MPEGGHRTRTISVMVTRRCTMTCAHCSVESSPSVAHPGPEESALLALVEDAAEAGVAAINFTGGEPMVRDRLVIRLMREAYARGIHSGLTTNGYWGRKPEHAAELLDALLSAGLARLTISYDRYHAEFQGPEPAVNIVRAAAARQLTVHINITRMRGDADLDAITSPFDGFPNVMLRFYDVQPVGFAAIGLRDEDWRGSVDGFCNACESPAITDDGRVTACNGPAYFTPPDNPLQIGSLADTPLPELLRRHENDPLLDTIRTSGPAYLRDLLKTLPEGAAFPWREQYRGMCDLCLHLNSSPGAVKALRRVLAEPERAAEREARRLLIHSQRARGQLQPAWVNGPGAARLLHRALCDADHASRADWQESVERVFGRADLDWNRQLRRLIDAGLAHRGHALIANSVLSDWAPAFVVDRLARAAEHESSRATLIDTAMATLQACRKALAMEGLQLVPAYGSAVRDALMQCSDSAAAALRTPQVLQLLALPSAAQRPARRARWSKSVISLLEQAGLHVDRSTDDQRPAERTLLLHWGALPVQITHVPQWLAAAVDEPVTDGTKLPPAAQLLLSLEQIAERGFAGGAASAWDVDAWLGMPPEMIDGLQQTFPALMQASPVPRQAWVALTALDHVFDLRPAVSAWLAGAPDDARQHRLVRIACHRVLLERGTNVDRLDVFSRFAIGWLLRDNWPERSRWVGATVGQADVTRVPRLAGDARIAWRRYRAYRRAAAKR